MWRGEGSGREDKQPPAVGKFCKRASGLKKPLAVKWAKTEFGKAR